jgi:hypothetical protein
LDKTLNPGGILDGWIVYWCVAILGGFAGGYIIYLIGSWFYNVRLKWSGGTSNIETSKHIYLYSAAVANAAVILSAIITFILTNKPSDDISIYYSLITILFVMAFSFYSIYVSFCGVITITDVDHNKARLWFLVLPIAVYALSYIVALHPYFTYYIE